MEYAISKSSKVLPFLLVVGGLAVGFANGFFGGGGGMLAVPLLTLLLALPEREAHATALIVILPMSIGSALVYLFCGGFRSAEGFPVLFGVIIGGIIGSFLLKKIKNNLLCYIFYTLMIAVGIRLAV